MATAPQAQTPSRRSWLSIAPDAPAVLFALKTYAAAVAAYWIALSVGMEHPSWAITTAFITSQPLAGGVVGKAIYRLLGTILSGAMAILFVPNLVNAPELLALVLALWLGFCSFIAGLNRSPSSYVFLMSGYTVAIISYPVLNAPQTVFTIAAFRVQEIGLGIICAAFFHGAIWPQTITAKLRTRVREIVAATEHASIDALTSTTYDRGVADRRKLATDLDELRQLSASLPFDTARLMPRTATVRALRDQLMQVLPIATTVEDRRHAFMALEPLPAPVLAVLTETQAWLGAPYDAATDTAHADALTERARALEPEPPHPPAWCDLLLLTLLARLAELIELHHNCRMLAAQVSEPDQIFRRTTVPIVQRHRWRSMHVDIAGGLRLAAGAVLTTLLACTFWIAAAWDQGGNAVLFAGVVTALFGGIDNPRAVIAVFLQGVVIGSLTGIFYAFAVLPRVTDFALMMTVLAPAFLIGGVGIATPSTSGRSLGFVIGLITASGIDLRYDSDFSSVINGTIALVLGVMFASVMISLTASVDAEAGVRRLIRAGWRDIGRRANLPGRPDLGDWLARMSDRIGLLTPRLAKLGLDPGRPFGDALTDLRTGVTAAYLRELRVDAPATAPLVTPVLAGVSRYFGALDPKAPVPPPAALRAAIDDAIARLDQCDPAQRRRGLAALVGLRRNLYPGEAMTAAAA
jgi:uncharacterized membrane protein YccC